MSKKRAKSGAGSAGVSRWESGLLSTHLEEEGWKACISFVIGNALDDKEYASILSSAVDSKLRRLFSVIYRDSLVEEVNELGNPKVKKGKDVPQFFEICETVKAEYLDKGEEIPLGLLAKLLKWKLLAIKEKDLKRREDEKKALENKDVKGGKGGKEAGGGKRARSKSPAKGKGKKSPEVPSPKKDSKLKKRGEEDDDNKYIDDEPDDGPQHYVIIEGFDQAPLLSLLTDLGININCIIRLQAEDYSLFEKRRKEEEEEMDEDDRPPEVIEEEKRTKEAAKDRLEKFWLQHEPLLKRASKGSKLQDVARLTYTVRNHIVPDDMKDNEKRTQFGTDLFEDVACMMYDLLDSERQYRNFLDNMKLIQVPVVEKDAQASESQSMVPAGGTAPQQQATGQAAPSEAGATAPELKPIVVSADVDTRYYSELMDSIPQESISVPLIMHCMLEQVVATSEERGPPSDKDKIPREDGLDQGLAAHIDKMAAKLHIDTGSNKDDEQRKGPPNDVTPAQLLAPTTPEFFPFGDNISLRLKHLQAINGFNAMEAELAMLDYVPVAKLREFPRPSSSIIKQRAARLQELLHHLSSGVVDSAEVDRAFKQFVFESLVLRGTEEDGCVSQQVVSEGIVWDDPYPLFTKREKDESESMEKEEGCIQKLTTENVQKNEDELESKEREHQTHVISTGILKPEGRKSRQGSASSLRSAKSTGRPSSAVHFEKDASGQPIIPPKDPLPPSDTPRETQGDSLNEMEGNKDTTRPGSSRSNISIHDVIGDTQLRNLDEWCYAEHFESHVLIQILEEAREMYPFMDTYYHKRDHTLLVVMHNPVGSDLKNTQPWDAKLHSDVGFRNYMEHVAKNISDWVDIEETKYQAEMREKELAQQRELAASRASSQTPTSRPTSSKGSRKGTAKKSRSKSPKGRRSASPAQTVDHLDPNSKQFMRPGSMKAWKVEQDKIREEEERKRLEKEKKAGRKSARSRSRSASPVKKGDTDEKKDKKPGSAGKDGSGRGSRKGDKDKKDSGAAPAEPQEEAPPEIPKEPERVYPFVGYDMGNDIIQANGNTTTLFPSDGGQIRTEHTQFINGPKFVKTSVLKDGHVFVVHILDPRDKEEVEEGGAEEKAPQEGGEENNKERVTEKADEETQEKDQKGDQDGKKKKKDLPLSSFGSFTANLSDGMVLSFSNHGIEGKTKKAEKKEIEVFIPPAPSPTPPPPAPSPKGKRGGSGKKGKQQQQQQQQAEAERQAQLLAEQQQKEEEERRRKELEAEAAAAEPEVPPFQQLFVSCPDGLHVSYMLEPTGDDEVCDPNVPGRLLIRQCYLTKNSSQQPCEAPRENPALQEISRLVTSEGSVIKMMKDGSTQVLFADGAVSYSPAVPSSTANPSSPTPRDQSPQRGGSSLSQRSESPSKKSAKGKSSDPLDQDQPLPESSSSSTQEWVTTTPTGQRIGTRPDGTSFEPKECLLYSATDPVSGEVLTTREDRVITVDRPNKMRIVDHNEGTRITTYYKKVIFRQQCDEAKETGETPVSGIRDVKHVKVECVGYATVIFNCEDSVATTIFGNGSEIVAIPDGSFEILHCEGSRLAVGVDGTARYTPKEAESGEPSLIGSYTMQHNDVVAVETCDSDGNQFMVKWNGDIYTSLVPSEESKVTLDGEGEEEEKAPPKMSPIPRFFVIHPDGSGTEMLRQQDIAPYVHQAGMDPNVAVLKDPIPDHPEIHGITVMQPHTSTISQKWLNQFDEPNIIPRNLRSREFDKLPAMEAKIPGPKFGTKVGRGVAVNTVPRPPKRGPVPKCPKQLQLRQFVAYRPMEPELRGKMKEGLEAYAKEMKKKLMEAKQRAIKDPRSQQERVKSGDLLAHILAQLEDDSVKESDGTQPISTDAPPASQGLTSTEPIRPLNVQTEGNAATLYETSTAPPPLPPPPRPKPKYTDADWERVKRDHEEEKACRHALLTRTVPPYFESDWGKAFKRAEEAVANGEPAPDMEALTKDLPPGNRQGGVSTAMSLPSTPSDSPAAPSAQQGAISSAQQSDTSESISPLKATTTGSNQARDGLQSSTPSAQQGLVPASPSDTRPTNPTPGHATGQGTPTALRPTNPTPAHASQPQGTGRPVNPTPQSASEMQGGHSNPTLPSETPSSYASFPAHPSTIPEMVEEGPLTSRSGMTGSISPAMVKTDVHAGISDVPMESRPNVIPSAGSDIVLTRSLLVDVNGEPRQDTVRLPAAILGQKPGALPNNRFDELEDSVRRKVFTSSIAGAKAKGTADLSRMRGFELVPGEVNFGTLREGCTYAFQVNLKNVGVDSCRYKVRQPPPSTGLQVVYSPGPVAAGMKAKLELILYAIAVGVEGDSGRGSIDHHLEITTEMELLYLPVSADILTAAEYDDRTHAGMQPKTSAGVRLIATRPPSREGIIRPRRDIPQQSQENLDV